MLLTIIFWILVGTALLWLLLLNVVGVAWIFSLTKRIIFGNQKPTKKDNLDE